MARKDIEKHNGNNMKRWRKYIDAISNSLGGGLETNALGAQHVRVRPRSLHFLKEIL